MMKQQVIIKSVSELRNLDPEDLKTYKAEVVRAKLEASTDFEKEAYINQLERVNTILNESETIAEYLEKQEKGFVQLKQEIQQTLDLFTLEVTA